MQVVVGKGITVDVDITKLNDVVMSHIQYIGLRNVLMDSHAGEPDATLAQAIVDKKLAALYAGEIRIGGTREGDPVRAEAMRFCIDQVKKAWKKAGRKLDTLDAKVARAKAAELLEKNPSIMELAKKRVAEAKAVDVEVTL